jgi:hypothetical protein
VQNKAKPQQKYHHIPKEQTLALSGHEIFELLSRPPKDDEQRPNLGQEDGKGNKDEWNR